MRIGREAWILGLLLLLFAAVTAYYAGSEYETQQRAQPSAHSTGPDGMAAAFRLLKRQRVVVRRFDRPLTELPPDVGLLVLAEPLSRPLDEDELESLKKWVEGGGALFLIVEDNPIRAVLHDPLAELAQIRMAESEPADLHPDGDSPYLRDIAAIHVDGMTRLQPHPGTNPNVLLADSEGAYVIAWKRGKGEIIAASEAVGLMNGRIARADTALLLANIAATHSAQGRAAVLFDEFHHGYGEAGPSKTLWAAIGAPARAVSLYLLAAFALVVYNLNVRFGAAKRIVLPAYRPSTEYISSMAALYRRAGRADVALEEIYHRFVAKLATRLDLPQPATAEEIAEQARRQHGWGAGPLQALLSRCEAALREDRIPEAELVRLSQQMDEYGRRAELDRIA